MTSAEPPAARTPGALAPGRFLLWWAVTAGLLAVFALPLADWLLLPWPDSGEFQWVAGLWQRKLALAQVCPGPRLLVVGGSATHFSVDAELLEARLGTPVYNLGTHAGTGLHFLLENAREAARPGDTVLLCLEDAHYRATQLPDFAQKALWTVAPRRLVRLAPAELVRQLYQVPLEQYRLGWQRRSAAMSKISSPEDLGYGYSMTELGPRGDQRGYAGVHETRVTAPVRLDRGVVREAARELEGFLAWAKRRGVKVVATLPGSLSTPLDTEMAPKRAEVLRQFYRPHGVPFLETPSLWPLPRELMLDSRYHANAAGRRIITEELLPPLAAALGRPLPAPVPGTLLVAGLQPGAGRELVLAREGAARCRFLAPAAVKSPLVLTPAQVQAASAQGERFLYADAEVQALLQGTGLPARVLQRQTATLAKWIEAGPQQVFALASTGGFATAPLSAGLPEPFHSFLAGPAAHKVALFSRAPGGVRLSKAAHDPAELLLPEREPWQSAWRFPMPLALRSADDQAAPFVVAHLPLEKGAPPGLSVAVLDPREGRLLRHATFSSPEKIEWELREIAPGAHALP